MCANPSNSNEDRSWWQIKHQGIMKGTVSLWWPQNDTKSYFSPFRDDIWLKQSGGLTDSQKHRWTYQLVQLQIHLYNVWIGNQPNDALHCNLIHHSSDSSVLTLVLWQTGSTRIFFVLEDNRKQLWRGSRNNGLTDIRGEALIQVKNRGQASKPKMCSKQAAEKWHPPLLSFFTKVFSTWLSVYIGVRYWLHPRIDMKKT